MEPEPCPFYINLGFWAGTPALFQAFHREHKALAPELIALSQADPNVVSSLIKPPQGGYDRAGNGQGTLADRISKGVPRRGELRGVFVRTALAGRLSLPGVQQGSRGGAEEPGVHIRMLRVWPADLDHGGHGCTAPSCR